MIKALSYDDVLLKPAYSDIRHRSEVEIGSDLGAELELSLPIIASPMDTVSEAAMAVSIGYLGGAAVIHRYNTIETQSREIAMAKDICMDKYKMSINVGAAVGISGDYIKRAIACVESGATFLCVDVAHGHHILMKEALSSLRKEFGNYTHIMAGNVATVSGFHIFIVVDKQQSQLNEKEKEQVNLYLRDQKFQKEWKNYTNLLIEHSFVKYFDPKLIIEPIENEGATADE